MTVLIFATDAVDDPCIDSVSAAIAEGGGNAVRVDCGAFPTDLMLSFHSGVPSRLRIQSAMLDLALTEVTAIWTRHIEVGQGLPADMREDYRQACVAESDHAVWSFLECVEELDLLMVDPPSHMRRVPHQPGQLQQAQRLGIEVPRTVVTNDAAAVRALASQSDTGVITKMITSSAVDVVEDGRVSPVYAEVLTPEELADLYGLDLCPMIFQELVPKALELRLTIVGRKVFAAAVKSGDSEKGKEDWRRDKELVASFEPYDHLPKEFEHRLLKLLDGWGLNFATADVILTPAGRYVLLEVNTISYFDFVERSAGLPISQEVAKLLLGVSKPRVRRQWSPWVEAPR